jgi:hypothetical protein
MWKKVCIMLSVIAALGLGIAASAEAKGHGGHGGHGGKAGHVGRSAHIGRSAHVSRSAHVGRSVHVSRTARVNRNVHVNGSAHGHYVVGRTYNGHVWFGHRGHFWHGAWYAYGVGPCWIYIDGLWFWNIAACPL